MLKKGLICLLALIALSCAGSECVAQTTEFRGLWADAWSPGFKTPADCDKLLADARYCNANAVVVQMRRRGDTYYPSPYEPFAADANPTFDALAYLIQKAHSGSPRIDVHCWFVALPVSGDTTPTNPNHPYNKYRQYLTKDDVGNTFGYENYWFDPGHPGCEEYLYNVMIDVVDRYDVDGIQFDYIRFGGNHQGYNDTSVARFNTRYGRSGLPAYDDSLWADWRRSQIANLVRKVYANAIAVKPNIKVSAATIPWGSAPADGGAWTNSAAYKSVFQDWRAWMQEGILDLNVPMVYADCGSDSRLIGWRNWTADNMYNRTAAIGLSTSGTDSCLSHQADIVRTASPAGNKVSGMSMYNYNSSNFNLLKSIWPTRVSAPAMAWKTNPTKGHIKGSVTYGGAWVDGANVTISGPESRSMTADGTGFFAFIDLVPGAYSIVASKVGYGNVYGSATVTAGQVATGNLFFPVGNLVISSVQAGDATSSSITITWNTNVTATSQVAYGTNTDCSNLTVEDTNLVTAHSVTITGLQPLKGYYFKVISENPDVPLAISGPYAFVTDCYKPDIIVDNVDSGFSLVGNWFTGATSQDKYGADYRYCRTTTLTPDMFATFRPNIPTSGNYRVSVYYPQGANRPTDARHTVYYNGGNQTYTVNQEINGGKWNPLDTKSFAAGNAGYLQISNASAIASEYVVADAARFEYVPESTAPSVPQNLQAQVVSHEQVNLTWSPSTDNVGIGGYRIYRNNAVVGFSYTNSYSDNGLAGNKQYSYKTEAFDVNANRSAASSSINAVTLSTPPSPATVTCNKPAGIWQTSNPFEFTAVGGFGTGTVGYYYYAWDTNPTHTWDGSEWVWAGGPLNVNAVSGPDPYYLHITGYNSQGLPNGNIDLGPYYLDTTSPQTPSVDDGGKYTGAGSFDAAINAVDPDSGITELKYAVGTTSGGFDVLGWTSVSPNGPITVSAPSAGTTYYVSAQAKNGSGFWSAIGTSDGITGAQTVSTIPALRGITPGTTVILADKVVSVNFSDHLYAQEQDRSAGVKVEASSSAAPGAVASIAGIWTVTGGIGWLANGEVKTSSSIDAPLALGMGCISVGGTDASAILTGIPGSLGPYNIGLYVRVFGKVLSTGSGFFTIDDGSGAVIKVYSSASVSEGQVVGASGISLSEMDGQTKVRVVKTGAAANVTVQGP